MREFPQDCFYRFHQQWSVLTRYNREKNRFWVWIQVRSSWCNTSDNYRVSLHYNNVRFMRLWTNIRSYVLKQWTAHEIIIQSKWEHHNCSCSTEPNISLNLASDFLSALITAARRYTARVFNLDFFFCYFIRRRHWEKNKQTLFANQMRVVLNWILPPTRKGSE